MKLMPESRSGWCTVAAVAGAVFLAELFVGFGLWFNPGWANGWPGGLSIHVVLPTGLAAHTAVTLMTAAVGLAAAGLALFNRPSNRGVLVFFLVVMLAGTLFVSGTMFFKLRAQAVAMWPQGYNPRR